MFFTIGKIPDQRLPFFTQIGTWVISHDSGWNQSENILSKGLGINWTKIIVDQDVKLEHDQPRSYPLWWNKENNTLTNFLGDGDPVWADRKIQISNAGIVEEFQNILSHTPIEQLSLDQCADEIIDILLSQVADLDHVIFPKKLFVSGGIDTILLYALIRHTQRNDVEILNCEHFDYDIFTNHHYQKIKTHHWAYNQIHHWTNPTVLLTGGCGDEFFMRGPSTLALWAAWHDIDLPEMLKNSQGYHVGYFLKPKNFNVFVTHWDQRDSLKSLYPTKEDLVKQILNINANDHQHWHLGETLTWTPFKNLEITKRTLSLGVDDMVAQIIDAKLNKRIIEKLYPDALSLLSSTKNSNSRENLDGLL